MSRRSGPVEIFDPSLASPRSPEQGPGEPLFTPTAALEFTHALRTPLGALSSALQVLGLPDIDDLLRSDAGQVALRQQQLITELIDDFESYWRLVAEAPFGDDIVDFSAVVADAVASTPAWRGAARIAIAPAIAVRGDQRALRHAIEAVVRYFDYTGVSLSVERDLAAPQVLLRISSDARYSNRSERRMGIPRHHFSLAMARRVIQLHGGTIKQRQWDQGIDLTLSLPAV